jgi:hypothetical protein
VIDADDFAHHRAGIENLLVLAATLDEVDQDRIRFAMQQRRDPDGAASMIGPLDAPTPGARLVAAMLAADAELTESQVAELDTLIDSRLADF